MLVYQRVSFIGHKYFWAIPLHPKKNVKTFADPHLELGGSSRLGAFSEHGKPR